MSGRTETKERGRLPRIAVTIGDVAGIGPEIVVKSFSTPDLKEVCDPVIVGDRNYLRKTAKQLGLDVKFSSDDNISKFSDAVAVHDIGNLPENIVPGVENGVSGKAAAEYIIAAVDLWKEGVIDAIATAPISKKAILLGGYDFPGHTEFLADLTGTKKVAMSFFGGDLRIVLLSTHISLRQAIDFVTMENLVDLIAFAAKELEKLLHRRPRLAMAGLNPHASEGGMFGTEEEHEIIPAVTECRDKLGIDISGPYSPDTIFLRAHRGEFDAVVACYHDQATIPVKSLSFGSSVNVTLGLPLVRTSVDHGTAFDIAGKGVADASSMIAAIRLAAHLAAV